MARSPGTNVCVAAALCTIVASAAGAQGGWRQWDVHLRDGTRVVANPLGAPDDAHLSISVGGFEGHDSTIARSRVDYIAVPPTSASSDSGPPVRRPSVPAARACEDMIVRLNGRRTTGHVTLTRIMYSEGVVRQRGVDIDLTQIGYIQFASEPRMKCSRSKRRV
jgi:hypothetical protein